MYRLRNEKRGVSLVPCAFAFQSNNTVWICFYLDSMFDEHALIFMLEYLVVVGGFFYFQVNALLIFF